MPPPSPAARSASSSYVTHREGRQPPFLPAHRMTREPNGAIA
ncbi:hypothetical protein ACFPM0_08505 [Pseudonocardia sulfidoxydans]